MSMFHKGRFAVLVSSLTLLGLLLTGCSGATSKPEPAASPKEAAAPAAAPAPAPAPASTFDKLVVVAVPVQGSDNIPPEEKALKSCVPKTRFKKNEKITWLIKVMDPRTGEYLGDDALGEVAVRLADGQVIEARYGPRPQKEPKDHYWANGWLIPEDYPTGTLKWSVIVKAKDGRVGQLVEFINPTVDLVILDEKVPVLKKAGG